MSAKYRFAVRRSDNTIDEAATRCRVCEIQHKAADEWAREQSYESIEDYVRKELDPIIGGLDDTRRTRQD